MTLCMGAAAWTPTAKSSGRAENFSTEARLGMTDIKLAARRRRSRRTRRRFSNQLLVAELDDRKFSARRGLEASQRRLHDRFGRTLHQQPQFGLRARVAHQNATALPQLLLDPADHGDET